MAALVRFADSRRTSREVREVPILLQKSFRTRDQISFGCTGDFHANMWGTSLPEEKLAGDPGNVIEATSICGRLSDFFTAGKLARAISDFCNNICQERTSTLCSHLVGA